jgi:hypothetical protein
MPLEQLHDTRRSLTHRWEYTYAILSGSVLLISLFRSFLFFHIALKAGTRMHNAMAHRCWSEPFAAATPSSSRSACLLEHQQTSALPQGIRASRTCVLCCKAAVRTLAMVLRKPNP